MTRKAIYEFTHVPTGHTFVGTVHECQEKWGYGRYHWDIDRKVGNIDMDFICLVDKETKEMPMGRKYWHSKAVAVLGL